MVIRAESPKRRVCIANREDPAQTAPSVCVCIFCGQFVFEILDILPKIDICIISLSVLMLKVPVDNNHSVMSGRLSVLKRITCLLQGTEL